MVSKTAMRGLLAIVLVAACADYDPVAEVPHDHREFADPRAAIAQILAESAPPRVYAIGEYHPPRFTGEARTPIAHFSDEVVALLEPRASRLVVESWIDRCGTSSTAPQLARQLARPVDATAAITQLAFTSARRHLVPRGLAITCLEQDAMRDPFGAVDLVRLLTLVTDKLHDAVVAELAHAPADRPAVIVYGGALHNDLFPQWPFERLSYAVPLARELGGDHPVLEIDLVVPEVVAAMPLVRLTAWFPLLARAAPGRTIVWQRGPSSYVVILPATSDAVAQIARPRD